MSTPIRAALFDMDGVLRHWTGRGRTTAEHSARLPAGTLRRLAYGEAFTLANLGTGPQNLNGWRVFEQRKGTNCRIPNGVTLAPEQEYEVRSGGDAVAGIVDGVDLRLVGTMQVAVQLQIVGRVGEYEVDRLFRQPVHRGDAVALHDGVEPSDVLRSGRRGERTHG